MSGILGYLVLALTIAQAPFADRPRSPFASSLPQLTAKEEAAIVRTIDRFIQFDIGELKGKDGEKAQADFKALGPEAIPQLLDGLNRAANLEGSCPAVLIARKLTQMLSASRDKDLLDLVRDNVGADVKAKRHLGTLQDVRLACQFRKAAIQREELAAKSRQPKAITAMTPAELAAAFRTERGVRLKEVLIELETRPGEAPLPTLVAASQDFDAGIQKLGKGLLASYLGRQSPEQVKARLMDERPEVRAAAAHAAGLKKHAFGSALIEMLNDPQAAVREAARQALVQVSGGLDFGPSPGAAAADRAASIRLWQEWWDKAGGAKR